MGNPNKGAGKQGKKSSGGHASNMSWTAAGEGGKQGDTSGKQGNKHKGGGALPKQEAGGSSSTGVTLTRGPKRDADPTFLQRVGSAGASASVSAKPAPVKKTDPKKAGAASASQKKKAKSHKSRDGRNKSKSREGKKVAGGGGVLDVTKLTAGGGGGTVPRGIGAVSSSSAASPEEGPATSHSANAPAFAKAASNEPVVAPVSVGIVPVVAPGKMSAFKAMLAKKRAAGPRFKRSVLLLESFESSRLKDGASGLPDPPKAVDPSSAQPDTKKVGGITVVAAASPSTVTAPVGGAKKSQSPRVQPKSAIAEVQAATSAAAVSVSAASVKYVPASSKNVSNVAGAKKRQREDEAAPAAKRERIPDKSPRQSSPIRERSLSAQSMASVVPDGATSDAPEIGSPVTKRGKSPSVPVAAPVVPAVPALNPVVPAVTALAAPVVAAPVVPALKATASSAHPSSGAVGEEVKAAVPEQDESLSKADEAAAKAAPEVLKPADVEMQGAVAEGADVVADGAGEVLADEEKVVNMTSKDKEPLTPLWMGRVRDDKTKKLPDLELQEVTGLPDLELQEEDFFDAAQPEETSVIPSAPQVADGEQEAAVPVGRDSHDGSMRTVGSTLSNVQTKEDAADEKVMPKIDDTNAKTESVGRLAVGTAAGDVVSTEVATAAVESTLRGTAPVFIPEKRPTKLEPLYWADGIGAPTYSSSPGPGQTETQAETHSVQRKDANPATSGGTPADTAVVAKAPHVEQTGGSAVKLKAVSSSQEKKEEGKVVAGDAASSPVGDAGVSVRASVRDERPTPPMNKTSPSPKASPKVASTKVSNREAKVSDKAVLDSDEIGIVRGGSAPTREEVPRTKEGSQAAKNLSTDVVRKVDRTVSAPGGPAPPDLKKKAAAGKVKASPKTAPATGPSAPKVASAAKVPPAPKTKPPPPKGSPATAKKNVPAPPQASPPKASPPKAPDRASSSSLPQRETSSKTQQKAASAKPSAPEAARPAKAKAPAAAVSVIDLEKLRQQQKIQYKHNQAILEILEPAEPSQRREKFDAKRKELTQKLKSALIEGGFTTEQEIENGVRQKEIENEALSSRGKEPKWTRSTLAKGIVEMGKKAFAGKR